MNLYGFPDVQFCTRGHERAYYPGGKSDSAADTADGHQRNPRGVVTCNESVILCNIFHDML